LEHVADAITAVAAARDVGERDIERISAIGRRLSALESAGA
jgi:hypothetical protein